MGKWKNNKTKIVYAIVILVVVVIVTGMMTVNIILNEKLSAKKEERGGNTIYKYHVAMIGRNPSDVFWHSVYKGAKEQGIKENVFVENFGAELSNEYSVEERMKMAVAANVDGIIVETQKNDEMKQLIEAAERKGIPVILMGNDLAGSSRKSFVSANDYTLGEMYGQEVLDAVKNQSDTANVSILVRQSSESSVPNLIYSGINETVITADAELELSPVMINENGEFESEETIRNLLLGRDKRPDVMVCLNAADTISAYQCVRDYNLVGQVTVIGFYTSSEILEGIERGVIKSTVVINAKEMGSLSAKAMYEYLTKEYVSEYIQVPSELITKETLDRHKNPKSE